MGARTPKAGPEEPPPPRSDRGGPSLPSLLLPARTTVAVAGRPRRARARAHARHSPGLPALRPPLCAAHPSASARAGALLCTPLGLRERGAGAGGLVRGGAFGDDEVTLGQERGGSEAQQSLQGGTGSGDVWRPGREAQPLGSALLPQRPHKEGGAGAKWLTLAVQLNVNTGSSPGEATGCPSLVLEALLVWANTVSIMAVFPLFEVRSSQF